MFVLAPSPQQQDCLSFLGIYYGDNFNLSFYSWAVCLFGSFSLRNELL